MIRLTDYLISLSRWLTEPGISRIIFCENSGADLDQLRSVAAQQNVHNQEIIFLSYTAPEADGVRGKSYGELGILSYVVSRQILDDSDRILKVTGRYAINNFESVLADIRRHSDADVITKTWKRPKWRDSHCFYTTIAFLNRYLLKKRELIYESEGFWLEHAFAQAIDEAVRDGAVHAEFTDLYVVGISGTANMPIGARRSPEGIELALTADYLSFFQATLDEFCRQMENNPERAGRSDTLRLVAKFTTCTSAISQPVLTNVTLTHADLRILQASIAGCLSEPDGFAERTGLSVEIAAKISRAIEQGLDSV